MRNAAIILLTLQMAAFAVAQQPFVPDANTVALWHFDEAIGTTASDESANGLHATLEGSTAWSAGQFAGGVHFAPSGSNCSISLDGTTAMGVVPHHSSLDFGLGDFTLEAMVRLDLIVSSYDPAILFKMSGSGLNYYALQILNGATVPQFSGRGDGVEWTVPSSQALTLGQWYRVTGVRSGNDFIIYVDGIERGRQTLPVGNVSSSGDLGIGARLLAAPTMRHFPGDIDDVRMWNTARSESEIQADNFADLCGDEAGLVSYWTFDECGGALFSNEVAGGGDGTLTGAFTHEPATWATGSCPTAVAAYVNCGTSDLLRPSVFTVDAWVKADSIRPSTMLIVTSAKNFHGFRLFLGDGGKPAFDVQDGSFEGYNIAMSPDPIAAGEWHMLRGTFDGNMVRIYVDGEFKAETPGSLSPATYPLHIGADVTSPFVSDPFRGTVDEVRISDIARDPSSCGCSDPVGLSAAVWQCDEGSGDTLHDATMNNNHGVLMGGTDWASGICGNALDMDGANDYVEVPDSPPLDITGPLTIQFSFYPRSEPTSGIQHLIGKAGDGVNNTDWVYVLIFGEAREPYNPQGLYFQIGIENGAVAVYDPTPVPLNEWTCVTATFDGDSMKILVNGELRVAQSVNVQMVENNEPLLIGTGRYHTNFFDGRMDAIRIYPYDITDGTPSLTVVGPGLGDEWRVAQPNASCVEWSEINLTGNVRVDLYRNSALVWNITASVPAVQETLCVTLPCSVEAGTGYQILVQSLDDTTIRDLGDQFRVEPQCGPLHPDSGLVIHVESGIDVHLYWPVVTQDSCGGMLCGPVYYIVWYEATNGENLDFLGYTQDTLYTHAGVKAFESQMFYNVTTFNGSLSTITSALRDLGPHFSHREFVTYANRVRKSAEAMD